MTDDGRREQPTDRVLPATRVLSVVIVPFLIVAFSVLFFWPSGADTARLFVRAARASEWHRIEGGFVSVGCFASLMGIATIVHWQRFVHHNVAFWLWAGLYFTTPFLVFGVWFLNRRERTQARPGDLLLSPAAVAVIGAIGVAATLSSAFLFLRPNTAIRIWPWVLSELTARVIGAIFALGVAGVGVLVERRWSGARLPFQVELFMLALIALSVLRARGDFDTSRPLTWIFAVGFVALAVATIAFYAHMEALASRRSASVAEG